MLLGSLTNYLQNQGPLASSTETDAATAAVAANQSNEAGAEQAANSDYQPSTRAILISAIATDFDVANLKPEQLSELQTNLQQYGLINQKDLLAFSQLRAHMSNSETSSLESLDTMVSQEQGYQNQQSAKRLQALFQNLASARISNNPEAA